MSHAWSDQDKSVFRAVLTIAHFTGFSREEIACWTLDEIEEALSIIREERQMRISEMFALIDYYIIKTAKYTKNNGTKSKPDIVVDEAARKEAYKEADELRSKLTGQNIPSEDSTKKNIEVLQGMGLATNYKVVKVMTVEEFLQEREEKNIQGKSIINH